MANSNKRRFIPKDKPKSLVIMLVSCIKGFLPGIPLMLAGYYLKYEMLLGAGVFFYALCWFLFAVMWIVYIVGSLKGKYCNVEERDWCDQVW
ncbi:MAG: hypothetical protein OEV42_20180 [Deltaproteobacteria bacterium]|nr:hypothetical protein [Deltaproteobacteria bacterium]